MKIGDKKVGIFHYTLKNEDGIQIDSSEGKPPLAYVHNTKSLIPGMEKALDGKVAGDKFSTVIPPEEAYGPINKQLISQVPIANFPDKDKVKIGVQFQTDTPDGKRVATVMEINDDKVVVNFNHQLAGETLHFEVEIVEVRDATEDEIEHGHVHGEGGCGH